MAVIPNYEELKKKHPMYEAHATEWDLFRLAYDGGKEFIEFALQRHPRETVTNWQARLEEGFVFNYAQAIVDLFNFYLTEKPSTRVLSGLSEDEQYKMFCKDADLNGTDLEAFTNETQKLASVYGAVGILVNKFSNPNVATVSEEVRNNIYPYCAVYTPPNILDWKFRRNPINGRPQLIYLKLREPSEANDEEHYLIWHLSGWERYRTKGSGKDVVPVLEDEGDNPLDEIPFIWMQNLKSLTNPLLGISDIKEISRIVTSLVRNTSCGEEVIKYAGFPMMRLPMVQEGKEEGDGSVPVGHNATFPFDPEFGDGGKPDWLESVIGEPIEAILNWMDRKIDELFRIAHLSGVHGQRKSNNEVSSGLALRYEFQQLNSVLGQKAANLEETEKNIIRLWLKWQRRADLFNDIEISRQKSFSLDDLTLSLDNALKSLETVYSETFQKKMQEYIAKQSLPDLTEAEFTLIRDELGKAPFRAPGAELPKADAA